MARRFSYKLEVHLPDGDAFEESRVTLNIESLVKNFEASLAELTGNVPVSNSNFVKPRPHKSTSPGAHDAVEVAQSHAHSNHSDPHNHVP